MSSLRGRACAAAAVAAAALCSACGSSTPPASPTPQLTIACPSPQSGLSSRSQPVAITWSAPVASGGTAPVQTACTPASGSAFKVGTTMVVCTATGSAAAQTAMCMFPVTITGPPQISVTRFLAFGDSITFGKKSDPASFLAYSEPEPSYSYPSVLRSLLGARYPDQAVSIANEGLPGEAVGDGLSRLPSALATHAPEVLLLLDGANDLLGKPSSATTQYIASKLRDMVRTAKARVPSITVLLANFPPQWHGSVPYDRGAGADFVPELNQRIAEVASGEGATLVDLYAPLSVDVKRYIGADGLHPTEAGFTLMAETFYGVIRQQFELKTAATR